MQFFKILAPPIAIVLQMFTISESEKSSDIKNLSAQISDEQVTFNINEAKLVLDHEINKTDIISNLYSHSEETTDDQEIYQQEVEESKDLLRDQNNPMTTYKNNPSLSGYIYIDNPSTDISSDFPVTAATNITTTLQEQMAMENLPNTDKIFKTKENIDQIRNMMPTKIDLKRFITENYDTKNQTISALTKFKFFLLDDQDDLTLLTNFELFYSKYTRPSKKEIKKFLQMVRKSEVPFYKKLRALQKGFNYIFNKYFKILFKNETSEQIKYNLVNMKQTHIFVLHWLKNLEKIDYSRLDEIKHKNLFYIADFIIDKAFELLDMWEKPNKKNNLISVDGNFVITNFCYLEYKLNIKFFLIDFENKNGFKKAFKQCRSKIVSEIHHLYKSKNYLEKKFHDLGFYNLLRKNLQETSEMLFRSACHRYLVFDNGDSIIFEPELATRFKCDFFPIMTDLSTEYETINIIFINTPKSFNDSEPISELFFLPINPQNYIYLTLS